MRPPGLRHLRSRPVTGAPWGNPLGYDPDRDDPAEAACPHDVLLDEPPPTALTIAVECPPLPQGGAERIGAWLDAHRDARLVIIDVFTRVRGPKLRDDGAYDADYRAVAQAKAIADAYGVAVLLVAHTRPLLGARHPGPCPCCPCCPSPWSEHRCGCPWPVPGCP